MTSTLLFALSVLAVLVWVWMAIRHSTRRVEPWVRPAVEAAGLEWVDERPAPMFHTGPFPWATFRFGETQTEIGGVSGEWTSHHIIRVKHGAVVHEIWVRVRFARFGFVEADFLPTLETLRAANTD